MEKEYEEDEGITEEQAKRLVERIVDLGHSKEEAYASLAYVMNAEVKNDREDKSRTGIK